MGKIINNIAIRELYASLVVYHGALILGIDNVFSTYFIGGEDRNMTIAQESLIGAIGLYIRPTGSIIAMLLADRMGRIRILQFTMIMYMISWTIIGNSSSNGMLIAGRALSGIASGTQKSCVLYVSEICDKSRRGRLVALRTVLNTCGASIPMVMSYYCSWRFVASLSVVLSVSGLIQMCFIPETKYWYMSRRQRKNAEQSLRWFSTTATSVQVDEELSRIEHSFLSKLPSNASVCRILRHENNFKAFVLACILTSLQRGCGRLAIMSHIEHFLAALRTSYDSRKLVMGMGIIDFIACSLYALTADLFQRKSTLLKTVVSLIFILISVLGYDLVLRKFGISLPLLPVVLLYAYLIICFTVLSTSILLVSTELICNENRGTILSLVFAVTSFFGATYSFILPYALEYTHVNTILSYFLLNLVLILTVIKFCVPETSGKDLHECGDENEKEVAESMLGNK